MEKSKISCTKLLIAMFVIIYIIDSFLIPQNYIFYESKCGLLTEYGKLLNVSKMSYEWWRLVSNIFLHAGVFHLIMNCILLLITGTLVEKRIGTIKFFIVFFISGLVSSLLTMNFTNGAIGASGGIYGLIGFLFVLIWKDVEFLKQNAKLISIIFVLLNIIVPSIGNPVSLITHGSGFFIGICFSFYILKSDFKK